MSSEADYKVDQDELSPRRPSKKLTVIPSTGAVDGDKRNMVELQDFDNGQPASTKAVLASTSIRASKSYEDAFDTSVQKQPPAKPVNEKKWWMFWKGDENYSKAVPLHKLFRYATWFDWILLIIGIICAIIHGAALPGGLYVFGDLSNLFASYDFSLQFHNIARLEMRNAYANFSFEDDSTITSPLQSVNLMVVSPLVNLTSLNELVFNNTRPHYACLLTEYAESNMNNLTSPYDVLKEIVTNINFTLPVTTDSCSCLSAAIRILNDRARCYSTDTFFYGIQGVDGILWMVYLFIIVTLVVFLLAYVQISFTQLACERQVHKIRLAYYRAVLRQNIGWFDVNPSGELSSRLNDDIDKIHDGIGDKFVIMIQWFSTFISGFIVGLIKGWQLTLLLLALTPIMALSASVFSYLAASFSSHEQKLYAGAGAVAGEVLGSIRTVVAFGGEYKEIERFKGKLRDAMIIGAKKGIIVGISLGFIFFFIFATYSVAFWFGGYLISVDELLGGDVLAVFFAVITGAFSIGQAVPNINNLITASGAAGEVYDTIDRDPPIDSSSDEGITPEKFQPTIEFKDVCFTYPARPDVQVLQGLDMSVKMGQTVALVGPSGCGKSTVVQLIQRFYDIAAGQITVGGYDVKNLNLKWLRSNLGVVSQEPVLFDTTIADNIRHGRDEATQQDIEEAAKAANVHDFISQLPDRYETFVGDKGTQLSGGQKQRIAIARALVRDPKILLLDEATSALDAESEKIVQEALDKAREGRTTIVIAHRLSTIQTANVIASVENGRIVEMGTHEELMRNGGLYYELVTAQSYGEMGESFSLESTNLVKRARSYKSSESEGDAVIESQQSRVKHQTSRQDSIKFTGDTKISEKRLEKLEEEWDKDIKDVSILRVLGANAREWWLIVIGVLCSFFLGSIYPAFAIIFGEVFSVFNLPKEQVLNEVHLWAGLFLVIGVVAGIAMFARSVCFTVAGEKLTSRLRKRSFHAILRQEISWFDEERNSSGVLSTRLAQDASRVQGATGPRIGTLIESMFGMLVSIVIALVYSWILTFVLIGFVPVFIIAGLLEVKALTGHAGSNKEALEQAGKLAVDSMVNMRTVASLGIEDKFFNMYSTVIKKPFRRFQINTITFGISYAFSQGILFLGFALTFGFGAWQVTLPPDHIAHERFDDVFVVFMAVIFGAVGAGQASAFAPDYTKAKQSANRIFALLDREPVVDGYSKDGLQPENVVAEIKLDEVQFNYPARPDVPVLQGLSLSVNQGKTLALVGPSGCGKSTVVSLIERFYDPSNGMLKLHDVDLRDLNIRWLRNQIGIVSQEPVLFDASIADNIRYGANFRDVSDEEIVEAAKAANIHNFIETLPQGYSTNVGSKGTQLSGGQKQRIAIARALVRDPKILLLDEATSALDTESEKIVQEALDKAREGRTTIVIAHRLSTIYNSDCIAVIGNGVVIEKGTHSELMGQKGLYYRLNQYQIQAEVEDSMSENTRHVSIEPTIEI